MLVKVLIFCRAFNGLYAYHINDNMQVCTSLYRLADRFTLLS